MGKSEFEFRPRIEIIRFDSADIVTTGGLLGDGEMLPLIIR